MGVLLFDVDDKEVRKVDIRKHATLLKSSDQKNSDVSSGEMWVPQRVDFRELMGYINPYHLSAINVKARVSVGLGISGVPDASLIGNPYESFLDVIHQGAMDLEGCGNAYLEVARGGGGKVEELYWLPAGETEISKSRNLFRQTNTEGKTTIFRRYGVTLKGEEAKYADRHEVIHVKMPHNWSSYYGGPDWLGALRSILLSEAAYMFNADFFENHCIPSTIIYLSGKELQTKDDLTADQIEAKVKSEEEQVQDWLRNNFGKSGKRHRALVLTGGEVEGKLNFHSLQQPTKDGDFLKLIQQCRDDILSGHITPPRMVGVVVSGSLGGSGEAAGQLKIFRDLVIRPRQQIWESTLNRTLFKELGGKIKFTELDPEEYATTESQSPPIQQTQIETQKGIAPRDALILSLNKAMERFEEVA